MRNQGNRFLWMGIFYTVLFVIWTVLVQNVNLQHIGPERTEVGFALLNGWFHKLSGVNMLLYKITDWLGLIPVFVCLMFGVIGFLQMIKRKSLLKVDRDILLLGIYYLVVILVYLVFEVVPINYRPILIEGRLEVSYPSSTTLLVLSVMPTLVFQTRRRLHDCGFIKWIRILTILFSVFMVIGRLISGVHWFTDIVGAVLLSAGLFCMYKGIVILYVRKEE